MSNSGVDYDLARAVKCGFGSEYESLEKKRASRESVNVAREALLAAYYEYRKKFVPQKKLNIPTIL
ncbi:hypothetical protein DCAR_0206789 [Daucus carota subsp. sativus]|uniref:Uncharacterized protein n=1 Tax=Daucus carota subsp. sativus TaxID=79200 RepID=A0A166DFL9_DAUCS|nr:hypothetical protein DCAR_0206789 [Daucus carota subsp. sativus]